jgi:hypothetical protein
MCEIGACLVKSFALVIYPFYLKAWGNDLTNELAFLYLNAEEIYSCELGILFNRLAPQKCKEKASLSGAIF